MVRSVITDDHVFLKLRTQWENLYNLSSHHATPYQDWPWNYLYWKHMKGNKRLSIITYSTVGNTVVSILPMWVRKQLGLTIIEPIGSRGTDYVHALIAKGQGSDVLDDFLKWFAKSKVQILNIEDLPESAYYIADLKAAAQKYGLAFYYNNRYCPCYEIPLPQSWETYLADRTPRTKDDSNYYRRYAHKRARITLDLCSEASFINYHFLLHQKVRETRGDKGAYSNRLQTDLLSDYTHLAEANKALRLAFLKANGERCATVLGVESRNTRYNVTIGHDPCYAKLRPGTLLYGYDIQDCIDRGVKKYDLSRGDDPYKKMLGGVMKYNTRIVIARSEQLVDDYLRNQRLYWDGKDYAPTTE